MTAPKFKSLKTQLAAMVVASQTIIGNAQSALATDAKDVKGTISYS
jgi:hypothetical protein